MSRNYNSNRIQLMNGANSRASCTHPEPNHHQDDVDYYDNQLAQQATTEATLISRSTLETTWHKGNNYNIVIIYEYKMNT